MDVLRKQGETGNGKIDVNKTPARSPIRKRQMKRAKPGRAIAFRAAPAQSARLFSRGVHGLNEANGRLQTWHAHSPSCPRMISVQAPYRFITSSIANSTALPKSFAETVIVPVANSSILNERVYFFIETM